MNRASIFNRFRDISVQMYLGHELDLSGSHDVIGHVIIPYLRCHFQVYGCFIVIGSLSPAIFGPKNTGVMTLTFQCHVTPSVTWPIDSLYAISCWCPIGTKPLFSTVLRYLSSKTRAHTQKDSHFQWFYTLSHAIHYIGQTTRKPSCRWETRATRKPAKIAPIRRAYNVVADNTGLSSCV